MDISWFFNSYPGMFIAQSFSHSFITAIIVGRAIKAWRINNPLVRQKFRFLVVVFPLFSFPAYQLLNPARRSLSFRMEALFDINRWLNLEILGKIPLNTLFLLILSITAIIFLLQEAVPILRHLVTPQKTDFAIHSAESDPSVRGALESLPGEKPEAYILDDDDVLLYSTTGRNGSIYLSKGLVQSLDFEQLQAALAHEIAHISRNKKPLLLIIFLFRVLMFFNPVTLVEFRRVVQEEEKICDDIAVMITRKPSVLAETLKKLYLSEESRRKFKVKDLSKLDATIEERSHKLLIQSRIRRLEKEQEHIPEGFRLKIFLTIALVIGINYFVV